MWVLWLILRVIPAAIIVVYAAGKIARWPRLVERMWCPAWVRRDVFAVGVLLVSLIEINFGFAGALGLLSPAITVAIAACFCVGLSIYGSIALRTSGSCGCGGGNNSRSSIAILWLRNTALFGAIAFGRVFGTNAEKLVIHADIASAAISVIPLTIMAVVILFRMIVESNRRTHLAGAAGTFYRVQRYLAAG